MLFFSFFSPFVLICHSFTHSFFSPVFHGILKVCGPDTGGITCLICDSTADPIVLHFHKSETEFKESDRWLNCHSAPASEPGAGRGVLVCTLCSFQYQPTPSISLFLCSLLDISGFLNYLPLLFGKLYILFLFLLVVSLYTITHMYNF